LAAALAFGSLSLTLNALSAHETMSGNEPARISDAASAAVGICYPSAPGGAKLPFRG
jgi:hypothetical protein